MSEIINVVFISLLTGQFPIKNVKKLVYGHAHILWAHQGAVINMAIDNTDLFLIIEFINTILANYLKTNVVLPHYILLSSLILIFRFLNAIN